MTLTELGSLLVALAWAVAGATLGDRWGGCFAGLAAAVPAGFAGLVLGFLFYEGLNSLRPYTPPADGRPDTWRKVRTGLAAAGWMVLGIALQVGPPVAAVLLLRAR